MRYAMTGATGFVGGALARRLREEGHEVVALVRDTARATSLADLGVDLLPGDLDDHAALDRLCTGVDGLFHLAGWYKLGMRDGSAGDRVNVVGTRNVLEAALRNGVRRVVYTSTLAVNSDTEEQVVDETYRFTGRAPLALRPHQGRGPRRRARAGRPGPPGRDRPAGDGLRSRGHRADRRVHRTGRRGQATDGPRRRWSVLGARRRHRRRAPAGHGTRRARPLLHAGRSARHPGRRAHPGGPDRRDQGPGRAAGAGACGPLRRRWVWSGRVVPLPPGYAPETFRAGLATYYGSPARAERELGWRARPLDEGLRETVDALR